MFSREKARWLRVSSSPAIFQFLCLKNLVLLEHLLAESKGWNCSCLDDKSSWSLAMDSWSWVIKVLCASMVNFVSSALLIQRILLALNCWSKDKEAWTEGPALFRSFTIMARLLCHSTLKPMLLASPGVKMNSSKERVRLSSLPLVYNWDMTDPIHSNIKFLRGSVHLSISSIILGYFQSSLEHTTFNGGESNKNSGLGFAWVLSLFDPWKWLLWNLLSLGDC